MTVQQEFIGHMRAMSGSAFIRRGELIELYLRSRPYDLTWQEMAVEYNDVARLRNLPEIPL